MMDTKKPLTLPMVVVTGQHVSRLVEHGHFSFLRSEVSGIKPICRSWTGASGRKEDSLDGRDVCLVLLKGGPQTTIVRGSYKEVAQMVWGDV